MNQTNYFNNDRHDDNSIARYNHDDHSSSSHEKSTKKQNKNNDKFKQFNFDDHTLINQTNYDYYNNSIARCNYDNRSSSSHEKSTKRNKNNEELKQFLSDHDAREQLIDLKEKVNIRELAQSYDIGNKKKKKQKMFFYSPTVFLLRKTKNNKVPIPGHPK